MQSDLALIYTLLGRTGRWLNGGVGKGWGALMVPFVTCLVVAVRYLIKATHRRKALFGLRIQPRVVESWQQDP